MIQNRRRFLIRTVAEIRKARQYLEGLMKPLDS